MNVHHMHGEIFNARCIHCCTVVQWIDDLSTSTVCPACSKSNCMRPDVVWFGEMPFGLEFINMELQECDIFVAIGTSGTVSPASEFVSTARSHGAHTIELNLEPSGGWGYSSFKECKYGKATETLPRFVDQLLRGEGWYFKDSEKKD